MSQSHAESMIETLVHTALRFLVSILATAFVLPVFGVELPLAQNLTASAVMTFVHAALTYAIRRAFNARLGGAAS